MIPSQFSYLFWDYNLEDINLALHSFFVTERVLEKGDKNSVNWLFSKVGKSEIQNVVLSSGNISDATRNFWMMALGNNDKKL